MKLSLNRQPIHLALLVGIAMTALGCQAPLAMDEPRLPHPTVYDNQPRSIVFDTPKLRQLAQAKHDQAGWSLAPNMTWYYSRNTVRQTTEAGYQIPTTDQIITTTFDRQSITAGQTRDHYHTTTYRRSTTQTVR